MPPLPPPLPPETRTVGQLVAETLRLYGRRFWAALPLGIAVAVPDELSRGHSVTGRIAVLVVFAPGFALAYAVAVKLVLDPTPDRRAWLVAVGLGTVTFLPAAAVLPWFAIAAFGWFALVGLVVPVALVEGTGVGATLRRAVRLARADYVHALGSLATLAITYFLTRLVLVYLLRGTGEQTERVAIVLADVVISPVLFLGAVLLYVDQEARSRIGADGRLPRR